MKEFLLRKKIMSLFVGRYIYFYASTWVSHGRINVCTVLWWIKEIGEPLTAHGVNLDINFCKWLFDPPAPLGCYVYSCNPFHLLDRIFPTLIQNLFSEFLSVNFSFTSILATALCRWSPPVPWMTCSVSSEIWGKILLSWWKGLISYSIYESEEFIPMLWVTYYLLHFHCEMRNTWLKWKKSCIFSTCSEMWRVNFEKS